MLAPDYLDTLPDALVELFQQVEDDILRDIARRINKIGGLTSTAAWQAWRLEQTRAVYSRRSQDAGEVQRKSGCGNQTHFTGCRSHGPGR